MASTYPDDQPMNVHPQAETGLASALPGTDDVNG